MLFASNARGLLRLLRQANTIYAPNGETVQTQAKLYAQFRPGVFPDWALPGLKARWPESPGVEDNLINPKMAYGGWDSKIAQKELNWSDEDRREAERILLDPMHNLGETIQLEEPSVEAPWPDYERTAGGPKRGFPGKTTPQAICEVIKLTGSDPEHVLLYERKINGEDRPEVIKALEELIEERSSQYIPA